MNASPPAVEHPGTARAVWFTGKRQAALRREELPAVRAGEVLVSAVTSLVSAGTEMNFFRGHVTPTDHVTLPTMRGTVPYPVKYGYQVVGRVEEAGAGSGFAAGDLVFATHPHQDRFVIPVPLVYPVISGLTPQQAALTNMCAVAYGGLLEVPVRIGDVVGVSGLGVIGTLAAWLARRTAGRLILIDPLAERRDRATWVGADAVVHPDDAVSAIAELSEGRGADVYFEASGAPDALQTALSTTGAEGRVVVISYFGSRAVGLRLSPEFIQRRQRIVGTFAAELPGELLPRWDKRRKMRVAMEQLSRLDVTRLVSHRIPFAEAASAYRLIDEHPRESLGVLLEYEENVRGVI
jgi:2-desacetyl-2-hydroxyethyl bacteriochlorophyllide A dehydrogenase